MYIVLYTYADSILSEHQHVYKNFNRILLTSAQHYGHVGGVQVKNCSLMFSKCPTLSTFSSSSIHNLEFTEPYQSTGDPEIRSRIINYRPINKCQRILASIHSQGEAAYYRNIEY